MKTIIYTLGLMFVMSSCQETKKEKATPTEPEKELTTAEKIAMAHGFDQWDTVESIEFTFNVDRGEYHSERSWAWKPKTAEVTLMSAEDTITYNHKAVDSTSMKADMGFINDKYWLLTPFQLVWDTNSADFTEKSAQVAPISGDTLNLLTITYKGEGGYTPGDAYDIYYGEDFMIKEWVFRNGNSETPSMMTTFEDYEKFGPLTLAKSHKDSTGVLNINFTGVKVN